MTERAHDKPSDVCAEEAEVIVDGPGGTAFSFTPDAAAETSDRLLEGAIEARGQQARQKPDGSPEEKAVKEAD